MTKTAAGDFTGENVQIQSKDELGQLAKDFNHMKKQLKHLIGEVANSAEQVAASEQLTASAEETNRTAEEMTQSIQLIANGAEQSNQHLIESSHSLDEITLAIHNLAKNSSTISETGSIIIDQAKFGNSDVDQTVKQIHSINDKVIESSNVLQLLDTRSNEKEAVSTSTV